MENLILSAEYTNAKDAMLPRYKHCHRFLYTMSGEADITVGGTIYHVKSDTLTIISNFERYGACVTKEPYSHATICISSETPSLELYPLLCALFNRPTGYYHATDMSIQADKIRALIEQMVAVSSNIREKDAALIALFEILHHIAPQLFTERKHTEYAIVRDIQNAFENDMQQTYSLEQLAAQHHLSVYHLSHLFKRISGYPLMGYLQCCRLAAAKRLLAETQIPIEEIVERCGFSDSNNFGRTFKTKTDLSPSKFREKYR